MDGMSKDTGANDSGFCLPTVGQVDPIKTSLYTLDTRMLQAEGFLYEICKNLQILTGTRDMRFERGLNRGDRVTQGTRTGRVGGLRKPPGLREGTRGRRWDARDPFPNSPAALALAQAAEADSPGFFTRRHASVSPRDRLSPRKRTFVHSQTFQSQRLPSDHRDHGAEVPLVCAIQLTRVWCLLSLRTLFSFHLPIADPTARGF